MGKGLEGALESSHSKSERKGCSCTYSNLRDWRPSRCGMQVLEYLNNNGDAAPDGKGLKGKKPAKYKCIPVNLYCRHVDHAEKEEALCSQ